MPRMYSVSGGFHFEGALEIIEDRKNGPDAFGIGVFQHIGAFAFGAAAEVIELGLAAEQAVEQIVFLFEQTVAFGGDGFEGGGGIGDLGWVGFRHGFFRVHKFYFTSLSCVHTECERGTHGCMRYIRLRKAWPT